MKLSDDSQAMIIKIAAVITATPRWVAALLAAEGLSIPAAWMTWWLPVSAIFSAAMAVVEGLAFAFVFFSWRNQQDKNADKLFWLAIASAAVFVGVLAPYIAASVRSVALTAILSGPVSLGLWSSSVAASTIMIVVSVGYAQRTTRQVAPNSDLQAAKETIKDLRRQIAESEEQRKAAELRFGAAGDLIVHLFGDAKRDRILAAAQQWPELPASAIAIIAGSSQSYVSEVLRIFQCC